MFGGNHKAWNNYMTEEVWSWKGRKRATDLKKLKFKILINQNRIINPSADFLEEGGRVGRDWEGVFAVRKKGEGTK